MVLPVLAVPDCYVGRILRLAFPPLRFVQSEHLLVLQRAHRRHGLEALVK